MADSVIARNITGYLGRVKDPETGNYVTGDFMAQLHPLSNYQIAAADSILSRNDRGRSSPTRARSCWSITTSMATRWHR